MTVVGRIAYPYKNCKTLSLSHIIYKILLQGQCISKENIIKPSEDNPGKLFSDFVLGNVLLNRTFKAQGKK